MDSQLQLKVRNKCVCVGGGGDLEATIWEFTCCLIIYETSDLGFQDNPRITIPRDNGTMKMRPKVY